MEIIHNAPACCEVADPSELPVTTERREFNIARLICLFSAKDGTSFRVSTGKSVGDLGLCVEVYRRSGASPTEPCMETSVELEAKIGRFVQNCQVVRCPFVNAVGSRLSATQPQFLVVVNHSRTNKNNDICRNDLAC